MPCLASRKFQTRETRQVGWGEIRPQRPGSSSRTGVGQNTFFFFLMILFSLPPKRNFSDFPSGFDILGHIHFLFEGRGIRLQREEGWS